VEQAVLSQLNNDRAILRANDAYHFGRPAIDEIEMLFYPDIATAAADILRGEAQGLLVDLSIDPADFQALRAVDRFEAHSAGRSAYTSLYLNNTEAPLDEQPVRLPSLSTDIDSILTSLVSGHGVESTPRSSPALGVR
jgi:ABC-type transport system substrate-binding protein